MNFQGQDRLWDRIFCQVRVLQNFILTNLSLPVAGLTALTGLNLPDNQVSDISAVAGLTALTLLGLSDNRISNISAVAGLTDLTWLRLYNNQISDIKALTDNSGINRYDTVLLYYNGEGNPLSTTSCTVYIPQLQDRGVNVEYNCSSAIFHDKNLETVIRQAINKPTGDILKSDLQGVTELEAGEKNIRNIEGLQYCTNLTRLYLARNSVSYIGAVAELTNLTELDLSTNHIRNKKVRPSI